MSSTPAEHILPEIRWGICGTGRMASTIATELAALNGDGAQLCAVGSRSLAGAENFARSHNVPRAHGSYTDLARDPGVDVVYIATPPSLHCENALACIKYRKAVLCEKPFALNASEAVRMVRAAREGGVFLMEAMWTRFLPALTAVRTLIADGTLGRIRLLVGGGGFVPAFNPRSPLFDHRLGGGVLLDAGVYLVSIASLLLGRPDEIIARGVLGRSGVDEQDVILLRHRGGELALFYVSLATRRAPDLEILGEGGRLVIEAPVFRPTRLTLFRADAAPCVLEHPVDGSGYRGELLEVMAALRAGRRESPVVPLGESVAIMRTLDSIRAAVGLRYSQD
jgi:dihydrodiol dehydrogenase / D-xylose 1-dehydrogenase (NADP)